MTKNITFQPSSEQQSIIDIGSGRHLVLAPPGTGKTEMLALRVQKALESGVKPEEIICLTFTNRAARGMRERVEMKFPGSKVFIGNIHNYCMKFMFSNRLIPQSAAVMDEAEAELLMEEAKSQMNYFGGGTGELIRLSTYIKQKQMNFPAEILLPPQKKYLNDNDAQGVCYLYEKNKTALQLLDFDDLLTESYFVLNKKTPGIKFSKFKWVMVDEVQDLNALQWAIIKLISSDDVHVMFFGDYEQAIFSFMGARLDMLRTAAKNCEVHNLQKNFRSPSYLLDLFKEYAYCNLSFKWKKPPEAAVQKAASEDDLVIHAVNGIETMEDARIANILKHSKEMKGESAAVLVRTNRQADGLSTVMDRFKLEHFRVSGYDLFKRRLTKDTMAFLISLTSSWDRLSWARMYWIFSGIKQLSEARTLMIETYRHGLTPDEFLTGRAFSNSYLRSFLNIRAAGRVVVFDTETTGLNTQNDDIVQIAAKEIIDGKPGREFEVFLKTEKSLENTTAIHGVTPEFLNKNGLARKEGLQKFLEFLDGSPALAHNISYDRNILKHNLLREGLRDISEESKNWYDSLQLSRRCHPDLNSYKLGDLIRRFNLPEVRFHNALDDVRATVSLVYKLWDDMVAVTKKQDEFIFKNNKILSGLKVNFSGFYTGTWEKLSTNTGISEIIMSFTEFLSSSKSYALQKEEVEQIKKLTRHIDAKAGAGKLKDQLHTFLPEYRTYKESDLLLGTESIVISTIHKAKGLEFDTVFIPYCNNGIYPMSFFGKPEDEEEEARLLYVALTRSKKRIILTYNSRKELSPFIEPVRNYFVEKVD